MSDTERIREWIDAKRGDLDALRLECAEAEARHTVLLRDIRKLSAIIADAEKCLADALAKAQAEAE